MEPPSAASCLVCVLSALTDSRHNKRTRSCTYTGRRRQPASLEAPWGLGPWARLHAALASCDRAAKTRRLSTNLKAALSQRRLPDAHDTTD